MKNILLLILLLSPARLWAWGEPKRAVFLVVLPENFSQWRALAGLIAADTRLKLTLALTPEMLTPQVSDLFALPAQAGRVEFAMRLSGDPVLPLVHQHSAPPGFQDSLARIALAREKFRLVLSTAAVGFIPGNGAVTADMAALFQALAIPWVAVGQGQPPATAQSIFPSPKEGAAYLPCVAIRGAELPPDLAANPEAPCLVWDEAGGLVPSGSLLALLNDKAQRSTRVWETASQAFSRSESQTPAETLTPQSDARTQNWPGWSTDLDTAPAAAAAWKAYGETAAALQRYQNSGIADLKALEKATEELYAAQASRLYRSLEEASGPADRELRQRLMAVYRKIKTPVPGRLFTSFLSGQTPAGTTAAAGAEETTTDLRSDHGASWISFQNPAGSLSRAPPANAPAASAGDGKAAAPDAAPWKIIAFKIEWDEQSISFLYQMAGQDAQAAPGGGLGRLILDTYIDINHVPAAGSSALLDGRNAFAANRDCWEYALSIGASGGVLLRATPDAGPAFLAPAAVSVDAQRTIRATIPRALLRGNPLRWGYIVAAFASQATNAGLSPVAAPPVLPGGPLGLLAPLELQKAQTPGQRLNAVRLSD